MRKQTVLFLMLLFAGKMLAGTLCELPSSVTDVAKPVVSLNGQWEFCDQADRDDWHAKDLVWKAIAVPGEPMMQGFKVEHDKWYAYRLKFTLPREKRAYRNIVRFNGVYSHSKLWLNNTYIRDHRGGFTPWEADLGAYADPEGNVDMIVAFKDEKDEISYGSGYAHHCIGGILRNVELVTLPQTYISQMDVETPLDAQYRDAELNIRTTVKGEGESRVEYSLKDAAGKQIARGKGPGFRITAPHKWSDETPYLYELTAVLYVDGKQTQTLTRNVGFRSVERKGEKVYVNGNPIKLRGACRHDVHPTLGRCATDETDLQDVLMAREANMNFIRTSHYPPSRRFLDLCDEHGIYVEDETAICFVGSHRADGSGGATMKNPAYRDRYLDQFMEMIEHDRNHPSVILWSLGNESTWGSNFAAELDYIRQADTMRPIIFSYPGSVKDDSVPYDILSIHYPGANGTHHNRQLWIRDWQYNGFPILADEWAHVACYNVHSIDRDPGVRDFWGRSIENFWSACYQAPAGLGGAIWGMLDEVFMLPDTVVGYGEWGFIDVWRRRKPEFFHVRKAHSPIRVLKMDFTGHTGDLRLPVHNRYNHILLSEVEAFVDGIPVRMPDLAPDGKGEMAIPAKLLAGKEYADVWFTYRGAEVDRERLTLAKPSAPAPLPVHAPLAMTEDKQSVRLANADGFRITLSKTTGLVDCVTLNADTLCGAGPYITFVTRGPFVKKGLLNLNSLVENATAWQKDDFQCSATDAGFEFRTRGSAGLLNVELTMTVTRNGQMDIRYSVLNSPKSINEIGISFVMPSSMDRIQWVRSAQWSLYPEGHMGRASGVLAAVSEPDYSMEYRVRPQHEWGQDTKNFYLFGTSGIFPGKNNQSQDFRATRLNVLRYALYCGDSNLGVVVAGPQKGVRAGADQGRMKLRIFEKVTYSDLNWGNYEDSQKTPRFPCGARIGFGRVGN